MKKGVLYSIETSVLQKSRQVSNKNQETCLGIFKTRVLFSTKTHVLKTSRQVSYKHQDRRLKKLRQVSYKK
jgi:hypothetical protein